MASLISRRSALQAAIVAGVLGPMVGAELLSRPSARAADTEAVSAVPRQAPDPGAVPIATRAITVGGGAVFARLLQTAAGRNVAYSPYSLVTALAMTRVGARGATAAAMDRVLASGRPDRLDGGLGSLSQLMATRAGEKERFDGSTGTLTWREANSLWGQAGVAWKQPFLDTLARAYGTGMHGVDYLRDAEGARQSVNAWVAHQTQNLIPELIARGVFTELTRLTLVNAIYLKAPWQSPFGISATRDGRFTRPDGSSVSAPLMDTTAPARYARSRGWQIASLPYVGDELAFAVVLPDPGQEDVVRRLVSGTGLTSVLAGLRELRPVQIVMPRFTLRTTSLLTEPLIALGMGVAFDPTRADLTGLTTQEPLHISAVVQQVVLAVDEEGTEAAAATAVAAGAASAPVAVPILRLDRPFYAIVYDRATSAPLFLAHVTDPTESA